MSKSELFRRTVQGGNMTDQKVCPREPTQEMDDAASNVDRSNLPGMFRREVWRRMYDAAPASADDDALVARLRNAWPQLDVHSDAIARLTAQAAEIAALKDENSQWRTWGTIEVAIRNPSVAESMRHWEGRADRAEAELTRAQNSASNSAALVNELRAERVALAKDAARYRWLREKACGAVGSMSVVAYGPTSRIENCTLRKGEALDAAIDAALGEAP